VVDHVAEEKDATYFVPVETGEAKGKVLIKGLMEQLSKLKGCDVHSSVIRSPVGGKFSSAWAST